MAHSNGERAPAGAERRGTAVPIELGSSVRQMMGAVVVLVALAGLALFMRWAFGSDSARERPAPVDEGLLTRVATLSHRESALALRAVLSDAGIRSTVRCPAAGRTHVLVFREDADRARSLAASFVPPG